MDFKKVSTSAIVNINHIIEQNYIRSSNIRFVIFVNKLSRMNAHARAHTPTRTNTKKQRARGVRLPNKVMSGQVRDESSSISRNPLEFSVKPHNVVSITDDLGV